MRNLAAFAATILSLQMTNTVHADGLKISDYQYGSQWSRRAPRKADLADSTKRMVIGSSIAIGGATGIYLGKFNDQHLIATANHAINYPGCSMIMMTGFRASNGFLSRPSSCLATFEELDLALLTFRVESKTVENQLKGLATNFAFNEVPKENEKLLFAGHPAAGNPKQALMLGEDEDCRVVSKTGDVRLLDDPDTVNPNGYASWQIANACDTSHGDSGAGLFSKESGKLLAIVSSGTYPTNKKHQTSAGLNKDLKQNQRLRGK